MRSAHTLAPFAPPVIGPDHTAFPLSILALHTRGNPSRIFVTSAILRTMSSALSSADPVCAHVMTAIPDPVHFTMALIRKFLPLAPLLILHYTQSFSRRSMGAAFIAARQSVGALGLEV